MKDLPRPNISLWLVRCDEQLIEKGERHVAVHVAKYQYILHLLTPSLSVDGSNTGAATDSEESRVSSDINT